MLYLIVAVLAAVTIVALAYRQLFYVGNRIKICPLPVQSDPPQKDFVPHQKNKILITGGCGGIGRAMVNVLLDEKPEFVDHITVFDQFIPPKKRQDPRITYLQGDITNFDSVVKATVGCNVVFHVASLIDLRSKARHWPRIYNINVVGTHNVVEACVKNGVETLIYTGSSSSRLDFISVKKFGDKYRVLEDKNGKNNVFECDEKDSISHYGKSKLLAERAVIAANGRGVLRTSAILPSCVFGFEDRYWFDPNMEALQNKKPITGLTSNYAICGWSYNVSVARLHVLCAEALMDAKRRDLVAGESFYAVDCNVNRDVVMEEIDKALVKASKGQFNAPAGCEVLPPKLSDFIGVVANAIDWFFDGQVRHQVFQLGNKKAVIGYAEGDLSCDTTKAKRLLNFQPTSLEEAVSESANRYF